MKTIDESLVALNGSGGGGDFFALPSLSGGGGSFMGSSAPVAASAPPSLPSGSFDLSPLSGLRDTDKFRGNLVSDIKSAFQTFLTGSPVGRGGEYAVSDQRRFGYTSIRDAAAGYLQAVGLTFTADPIPTTGNGNSGSNLGEFFGLPVPPDGAVTGQQRTVVEQLIDALPRLFGASVVNPPLQSQATGYAPVSVGDGAGAGGGGGLGVWLLLGGIAIAAYFVYKKVSAS